ncbi:MAG: hypothetical protein AAFN74_01895 [Myxococcota bacterium]
MSLFWLGCSYLLPPTWRTFRADPDDAAPSIARALAAQQLRVDRWNQVDHSIVSRYLSSKKGEENIRERYIVRWERSNDGTLAIFVRHERQTKVIEDGVAKWDGAKHDPEKEADLLEAITRELEQLQRPVADVRAASRR